MDNFWENRRVLITGGHGFLGKYVVNLVRSYGAAAIVPSHSKCDFELWDVTRDFFKFTRPEVVIHLAAKVGGIGANMERPAEFFHDNMAMGMNIISASYSNLVEKLVLIGTTCSYPKFGPMPFSEDNFWNGYPEETNAPYGIAKKALFEMAAAYRKQYGLNTICLIPTNLYGPGDNFDPDSSHVIPALIKKFVDAKSQGLPVVKAWGDGTVSREFLYVEDCAEAIVAATEKYDGAELVNIGAGHEMNISALAITIAQAIGFKGQIEWEPQRPNGQPRRSLNTERAKEYFGWRAKTDFVDGLKKTVEWYLDSQQVA